jgi:hypothetical protein
MARFCWTCTPAWTSSGPGKPAHARHEYGAAQAIDRAVKPPRRARARVQQLALFDAAPEPCH